MRRLVVAFVFASILVAGGCSVYHPLSGGVGYTETPVGPDALQVTYVGPADMPVAEARDYAMLRAAELAVLRNDPYFQILNEQGYVNHGLQYWPGEDYTYVGGSWGGRHRHPVIYHTWTPGYWEPYTIPQYTLTVRPTTNPAANAVPANYLIQRALRAKIKLTPSVPERAAGMPLNVPANAPPPPPASLPPTTLPATQP
jgi:hypothetical protein